MNLSLQLPNNPFPGDIHVCQEDWLSDKPFVSALKNSWTNQYEDYLGKDAATTLIKKLNDNGDLYAHDPRLTIVARTGGKTVGIAAIRPLAPLVLITMLEVLPDYQRQGIGRRLIQVLASAKHRMVAHVSVYRPAAVAFYRSMQFAQLQRSMVNHYGHQLEFEVMVSEPYREDISRNLHSVSRT